MTRARETSENARLAKAMVSFNGYNNAITASFNVSSVTDASATAGQYYVNFENSMPDTNYIAVTASTVTSSGPVGTVHIGKTEATRLWLGTVASYGSVAYFDSNPVDVVVYYP